MDCHFPKCARTNEVGHRKFVSTSIECRTNEKQNMLQENCEPHPEGLYTCSSNRVLQLWTAKLQSLGLLLEKIYDTTIRLFYLRYCKNIGTYATQGGLNSMASSRKNISICLSTHLYGMIPQWSIYVTSSRGFEMSWYFMIILWFLSIATYMIWYMCVFFWSCLLIVWSAVLTVFSDWMQSVYTMFMMMHAQ